MKATIQTEQIQTGETKPYSQIRGEILNKFRRRMAELALEDTQSPFYCDIIVISADQSLLFEAQNTHASEALLRRCGLNAEGFAARDRIRVHPCQSAKIIADLEAAGLKIVH
ncbi:MAG TPA: hypothetical protein VN873_04155 [Candidatus Angelobacter sp.]|nr:hypothetical protein [Candidatus Angelobacter sp.]